jgi:hypothetical protein
MKAECRTGVGRVEISAIGLRPACLPALVRRWAARRGGGHELRPLHPVSIWTAPRPQRWRLPHGMMNQTNANRQDELFTTETTGLPVRDVRDQAGCVRELAERVRSCDASG